MFSRLILGLVFFGQLLFPAAAGEISRPLMKDFMGINGHTVQFRPKLYAPTCRLVRDYHPVEWDLGKDSSVPPQFPEAKNRVNWDSVYGSWLKEGFIIDACLMFESMPKENWKDVARDARAYGKYFAEEFGPSSRRKAVQSVEIGNEPGEWSDEEYRVMFQSMAEGLRAGDSKLLIASCALVVGPSHKYAKSVDCVKGLESNYDVLTMHTYAQVEGWPTWKRSYPEDPALKEYLSDVEKLCAWRDQNAAGKPVWITEFGYDSCTQKPVKEDEFKKWEGVSDLQQAQWLVRSFLVFSSMPVERAYLYFFNDNDEPRLHAAAGLTRKFEPKPSYWAVAHLYQTLGDFRFGRIVKNEKDIRIQEYVSGENPKKLIWVVWSPTGDEGEKQREVGVFPGSLVAASRMPLTKEAVPGDVKTEEAGVGWVAVSGSPIFLSFEVK